MDACAVVGLGSIAAKHRALIKQNYPSTKVFAVSASGRTPQQLPPDCDEFVADWDKLESLCLRFAIIASPAPFHLQHAEFFLKNNIDVLIEKPVESSLESARKLLAVSQASQAEASVGYCLKFLESAAFIKQIIDDARFGQVLHAELSVGQYLPYWREKDYKDSVSAKKSLGGGALLELSHDINYAQWLFGPLTLNFANIQNTGMLDIDVEDLVDIIAETNTGASVNIHLDFLQKQPSRYCRIIFEHETIYWNVIHDTVILKGSGGDKVLFKRDHPGTQYMYSNMLEAFLQHAQRTKFSTSVEDAVSTIEFIEQVKITSK